jgi:glutamyl endopeptidase
VLRREFHPGRYFTVFHEDERERVEGANLRRSPYRMICSIEAQYGNGWRPHASGFLVGPRTVATAGHNLVRSGVRTGPVRLRFGRDRDSSIMDLVCPETSQMVHPAYVQGNSVLHDVALLRLEKRIGDELGCFTMTAFSDHELAALARLHVAGYPTALAPPLASEPRGRELWHHFSRAKAAGDRLLHTADSSRGQSGGPVFADGDGVYPAAGVHTSDEGSDHPGWNAAFRFTADSIRLLESWPMW